MFNEFSCEVKIWSQGINEEMLHVKHKKTFTTLSEWCSILGKVKINNRHSVFLSYFFRKPSRDVSTCCLCNV